MTGPEALRATILERHRSVHAFCRAHPEVTRSTVYLVLAGRYPGRVDVQAARIRAALAAPAIQDGTPPVLFPSESHTRTDVQEALQSIRCNHCRLLDKARCRECRTQTAREAAELFAYLFPAQEAP